MCSACQIFGNHPLALFLTGNPKEIDYGFQLIRERRDRRLSLPFIWKMLHLYVWCVFKMSLCINYWRRILIWLFHLLIPYPHTLLRSKGTLEWKNPPPFPNQEWYEDKMFSENTLTYLTLHKLLSPQEHQDQFTCSENFCLWHLSLTTTKMGRKHLLLLVFFTF